jgi:hypothetical protein
VDWTLAHCRSHRFSNNSEHIGPWRFSVSAVFPTAHEETQESRFPWANVEVDIHIGSRESRLNGLLMGCRKNHDSMRTSLTCLQVYPLSWKSYENSNGKVTRGSVTALNLCYCCCFFGSRAVAP